MIDELIPEIERLQAQGAVIVIKWDGERSHDRCTVVITRQDTDHVWRKDSEEIRETLSNALADYKAVHSG